MRNAADIVSACDKIIALIDPDDVLKQQGAKIELSDKLERSKTCDHWMIMSKVHKCFKLQRVRRASRCAHRSARLQVISNVRRTPKERRRRAVYVPRRHSTNARRSRTKEVEEEGGIRLGSHRKTTQKHCRNPSISLRAKRHQRMMTAVK